MNEFTSTSHLPLYIEIPAWRHTTLEELTLDLANSHPSSSSYPSSHPSSPPSLLPFPAIGTRLVYRLIYVDTRKDSSRPVSKDLGSVVIGAGLPGADSAAGLADDDPCYQDAQKTLGGGDAKFMPGDFISCAILPPNDLDGAVEPVSAARTGRGSGIGEGRSTAASPPPPRGRLGGMMDRDRDRDGGGGGGGYGRDYRIGDRYGDEATQARGYNRGGGGSGGDGGRYESNSYDWGGRRDGGRGGRNRGQREPGMMPQGDWRRGF